jgi:hypothetical protein
MGHKNYQEHLDCCATYRENNKEKIKAAQKDYISPSERCVKILKINGCSLCKEKEPICLDFHHLNPKIKENKRTFSSLSWEVFTKEIIKCICVCSNCHKKIHAGILDASNVKNIDIGDEKQYLKNISPLRNNKSGYRGVTPYIGKWRARTFKNGKDKIIGIFETKEEASQAYWEHTSRKHTPVGRKNTSGFTGVYQDKRDGRWQAYKVINKKQISLGRYDTPEEASQAYNNFTNEELNFQI